MHANQLKLRHTPNEIIDAFDLNDISDTDIEPVIVPQPEHENPQAATQVDSYDADIPYEDVQDKSRITVVQPAELGPRRSTRINAGVPPQRFGYDKKI